MGAAASWDALSQSQLLQRRFATGGVVPVLQCYYTELTRLNKYVREQGIVGKDLFAFAFGVQACRTLLHAACSASIPGRWRICGMYAIAGNLEPMSWFCLKGRNMLSLSPSTLQSVCQALHSYLYDALLKCSTCLLSGR